MYLLTEWEGRTGKYLARSHDVRTERGSYIMTESQTFSRPARSDSVNKHFIIYNLRSFSVFLSSCFFSILQRLHSIRGYFQRFGFINGVDTVN